MQTEHYPHKIAGVYPNDASAQEAFDVLEDAKLGDIKLIHLMPGTSNIDAIIEPEGDEARDTVVKDTAAGGAAGAGAGAALAGTAAVLAPTLFVSAPLVGPLMVLGYGSVIGATVGALRGIRLRKGVLSGLVKDSLNAGYHVILVHVTSNEARDRVDQVMAETLPEETTAT